MCNLTKDEIVEMYKRAKNKETQIEILAELTASDTETIVEVLKDAGVFNGTYITCSRCRARFPAISHNRKDGRRCKKCVMMGQRISKLKFMLKSNNAKMMEIQRKNAEYRMELDKLEAEWEI